MSNQSEQGVSSGSFRAFDPALGKEIDPPYQEASEADVDKALQAAAAAFLPFRKVHEEKRARFLEKIGDEIQLIGDQLLNRAQAETGLPRPRLEAERMRTINQLKMFASLIREGSWVDARIDTAAPDRKPMPKPDLRRMLIPLGPVVVFGASNFPLAFSVAGGDTVSALAAGCPVVVKAHPSHPGTSELVGQAILNAAADTQMPEGVFSQIQGCGNAVGVALVKHPLTTAVGFTGSLRGGRALFNAAMARPAPIPVYAEMGSINPVFILPAALKERSGLIAAGLHQSVTLGVGQFCTNPGLVVAPRGKDCEEFIRHIAEKIVTTPPGTMLNPGICKAFSQGLERFRAINGVTQIAQSRVEPNLELTQASATVFSTTAETFLKEDALSDELFGPATVIVQTTTLKELAEVARKLEGHLTASIHGTPADLEKHGDIIEILESKVGRLLFNDFPTGVEVCAAMQHGGPYPATTDSRTTSVGTGAILRFARPICYQNFPHDSLPPELRNENPMKIWRIVNNTFTRDPIAS